MRPSLTGEVNGKAGNLNNTLKNIYTRVDQITDDDVIAVFDCDQICSYDFFTKSLPKLLESELVALVGPVS